MDRAWPADFRILHWPGLRRHVGGLHAARRDKSGGITEEEAFHLVHVDAQVSSPCHPRLRANLVDVENGDVSRMRFATAVAKMLQGGSPRAKACPGLRRS